MSSITSKQETKAKELFFACRLFEGMSAELVESIFSATTLSHLKKGEQLYKAGNLCFLLSGKAKVYAQNSSVVMRNMESGDFFGAASLFCKQQTDGTVTAAADCIIAYLPEKEVAHLIESCPTFSRNYIAFLSDRIRFMNGKIYSFTDSDALQRVFKALCSYSDKNGKVNLPFSMAELANRLNIGRSSLYRAIDSLIASNKIKKDKYIYIKGE